VLSQEDLPHFDGARLRAPGVEVTLEGFDVRSGRTTWTWHAGVVEGLVVGGPADGRDADVLRLDDVRYLVRSGGRATLLDLDRGPVPGTPPAVGWCKADDNVDPGFRVSGYDAADGYRASGWHPCSADGPVALPSSVPPASRISPAPDSADADADADRPAGVGQPVGAADGIRST